MPWKKLTDRKSGMAALVIMCLLIATVPSFSQGGETIPDAASGAGDGTRQSSADARGNALWFVLGLLLPGVGMILPWVFSPTEPSDKLIGKSDEFVAVYRKANVRNRKYSNFRHERRVLERGLLELRGAGLLPPLAIRSSWRPRASRGCGGGAPVGLPRE
jgi:hypothetical protein